MDISAMNLIPRLLKSRTATNIKNSNASSVGFFSYPPGITSVLKSKEDELGRRPNQTLPSSVPRIPFTNMAKSQGHILTNVNSKRSMSPRIPIRYKNGRTTSSRISRKVLSVKTLSIEERQVLKFKIARAVQEGKVFRVDKTPAYAQIRRSLIQRGWVEKINSGAANVNSSLSIMSSQVLTDNFTEESLQSWLDRLLGNHRPDFIWILGRNRMNFLELLPNQIVNQFPRSPMTTKVGITEFLRNSHWVSEAGSGNTYFPRCYRLAFPEELRAFIQDFHLTACMAVLQWIVGGFEQYGEIGILSQGGRVDQRWLDFCVKQIQNYVRVRKHEDIDWIGVPYITMHGGWDYFLAQHRELAFAGAKFSKLNYSAQEMYDKAKSALQAVAPFWPQLNIDGARNLWICKPGAASRGHGIRVTNNINSVLNLVAADSINNSNKRNLNWVVQKYIERPLLIYKTKFDIRQWFIVSDWNPMSVWFYRECYLRFSSQQFTLDDLHVSIHLCNNIVQRKFQNSQVRDPALPEENMWDNYTFQAYLKTLGKENSWNDHIYPGMKKAILGVLLAGQDNFDFRPNCFELYGADFMLTEDFTPVLIEINGSPTMAASTSVTARMRNQVLEDCIKVIIDHRKNAQAPTGMFELIYKQSPNYRPHRKSQEISMRIEGKKLLKNESNMSVNPSKQKTSVYNNKKNFSKQSENLMKRFKLIEPKPKAPLLVPSEFEIENGWRTEENQENPSSVRTITYFGETEEMEFSEFDSESDIMSRELFEALHESPSVSKSSTEKSIVLVNKSTGSFTQSYFELVQKSKESITKSKKSFKTSKESVNSSKKAVKKSKESLDKSVELFHKSAESVFKSKKSLKLLTESSSKAEDSFETLNGPKKMRISSVSSIAKSKTSLKSTLASNKYKSIKSLQSSLFVE